MGQGSPAEEQQ
jgi:hypothetical protein